MTNIDIRERAKKSGVHLWRIADALGMADNTFSRKLRKEFPDELKAEIFEIIDRLAQEV